jgi:hypothetical protein
MGVEAGFLVECCSHFGGHLVLPILPNDRSELRGYSFPLPDVAMVRTFEQLATPHFEPVNPPHSTMLGPTVDSDWLFAP